MYFLFLFQNSGYVAAFPHATPGYIPSPLQSPYLTSPLAHINPAMMSLFPAVTSPTTLASAEGVAMTMAATADHTSRSVQMQAAAALLPAAAAGMSVHSQFQHPHHPAVAQQLQLTHQHHKAKAAGDRVEVRSNDFLT